MGLLLQQQLVVCVKVQSHLHGCCSPGCCCCCCICCCCCCCSCLLQLDVTQHRFLLCGDTSYKVALGGAVQGLADTEATVRSAAKTSLTPLLLSLSNEDCRFEGLSLSLCLLFCLSVSFSVPLSLCYLSAYRMGTSLSLLSVFILFRLLYLSPYDHFISLSVSFWPSPFCLPLSPQILLERLHLPCWPCLASQGAPRGAPLVV